MIQFRKNFKIIWAVAKNTFYETVRDKILYSLIGFALLVIAASIFAGSISLGEDVRVIESFSLTAIRVFLLIITLFVGTQLVFREVERKTIFITLTKPITRTQFFLGKYLGICLTLALCAAIMAVLFLITLYVKNHSIPLATIWALVCLLIESWLLTALGLLFSAFTTPIASAVYLFCLALIGHSANTILAIAEKNGGFVKGLLEVVYYVFPNLNKFDVTTEVIYNIHPRIEEIAFTLLYFFCYAALAIIVGSLLFNDNEF